MADEILPRQPTLYKKHSQFPSPGAHKHTHARMHGHTHTHTHTHTHVADNDNKKRLRKQKRLKKQTDHSLKGSIYFFFGQCCTTSGVEEQSKQPLKILLADQMISQRWTILMCQQSIPHTSLAVFFKNVFTIQTPVDLIYISDIKSNIWFKLFILPNTKWINIFVISFWHFRWNNAPSLASRIQAHWTVK